jgi:hypothetical protein
MIQEKLKQLISIVNELETAYPIKKFTLDGRLVGDIGELLASQKYQIRLHEKIVKKYDAVTEYDNRSVQIKATMKNTVWYPRDHHPDLFLAIEITPTGDLIELYNGETAPFIEYILTRKKNQNYNYYTITKGVLKELNLKVDPNTRIKLREI